MMLSAIAIGLSLAVMQQEPARAELVASVSGVKPGEPFLAAVVIRTDPSWHVYWKNPGDSGTPTTVEWVLPEGWKVGELMWPTPTRFQEQEMVTYGYEGATLLMAKITPSAEARPGPAKIEAKVAWLACKEQCIPGSASLRLPLSIVPVKASLSRTWGDRLIAAEQAMPAPAPKDWKFEANAVEGGFVLKATPPEPFDFSRSLPVFFPSDPGVLEHAEPQRFMKREDGSFWIAARQSQFLNERPKSLRGYLVAPKGTTWNGISDSIIVDVPITSGDQ